MTVVTRPHAQKFCAWAKDKPEVVVLSADLTSSCEADDFREAYPDRFFSMGMAEQNMMGFAGGLAREGFTPFVHTFAVFICRRPFDQVAMSIAYPNLRVRLFGFLPGLTTPGGVTHQAIDDLALMRILPNMTVVECGDATEVESVFDEIQKVNGPVYVRTLRGGVPRLFSSDEPFKLNQGRVISEGRDLLIVSSGVCTEEVLRASEALKRHGVNAAHLHISTIKPFTDPILPELLSSVKYGVITIENHSIIGGLGSAVAELIAELGLGRRLIRLGLQDTYAHGASRPYLMKKYGLDATALVEAVGELIDTEIAIDEKELCQPRQAPMHSKNKAEAL